MKKNKQKDEKWDDGRTIAPMNGDELPKYRQFGITDRESKKEYREKYGKGSSVNKKEFRAILKAFYSVILPRFLIILGGFCLIGLILYLWLK